MKLIEDPEPNRIIIELDRNEFDKLNTYLEITAKILVLKNLYLNHFFNKKLNFSTKQNLSKHLLKIKRFIYDPPVKLFKSHPFR